MIIRRFKAWVARQWAKAKMFIYTILVALGFVTPFMAIADDVSLSWTNATEWTDGTPLDPSDLESTTIKFQFFNLTAPPTPGGPRNYIELVTVPPTVTSFAHDNVPNGVYCYVGFHTAKNTEVSIDSDESCKTIDVRIPGTLTGLSAN